MKKLLSLALIVAVAALSLGLVAWSQTMEDTLPARLLAIVGTIIGLGWMIVTYLVVSTWLSDFLGNRSSET